MSWYAGLVAELRSGLARLHALDLWPPTDAAHRVAGLVADVLRVAIEPPLPDPATLADTGEEWLVVASAVDRAGEDLAAVSRAPGPAAWTGEAGESFRGSLARLGERVGTVGTATDAVTAALRTLAVAMDEARARHAMGAARVRAARVPLEWSDLNPFTLRDRLVDALDDVVAGASDLIGAYEDADDAVTAACRAVAAAMDEVALPTRLPTAGHLSAIEVLNAWSDPHGTLDEPSLDRYDRAWRSLSPTDREVARRALADADDRTTPWVLTAVAGGLGGATLRRYLERLRTMSPAEVASLDPARRSEEALPGRPFRQPDDTSCGSASLVVSRMVNDPAYDLWMMTGYDPATGLSDHRPLAERFADETRTMHHVTNGLRDGSGALQVPWPESLGTQPWAAAHQMSSGSGVPGHSYAVTPVDPHDRGATYDAVARAVRSGHAVPIYVGDALSPRHVMLVTAAGDGVLTGYDPASGGDVTLTRAQWASGTLPDRWSEPWAAVVPSS